MPWDKVLADRSGPVPQASSPARLCSMYDLPMVTRTGTRSEAISGTVAAAAPLDDAAAIRRLTTLNTALVCDVLDALGYRETFLGADIAALYPAGVLAGRAFTIAARQVAPTAEPIRPADPYRMLLESFADMRPGDVVVIGTGGERLSGIWGELLSIAARARGVTGVVTDGLVRDVEQTERLGFPVFGRGTSPLDSAGRLDVVSFGAPIACGRVRVAHGDYVLADRMGAVMIPYPMLGEVLDRAEDKRHGEGTTRQALAAGEPIDEVFARYGVL